MTVARTLCCVVALTMCIAASSLRAHEGHDHGPAPSTAQPADMPTLSGQTERFEIVAGQVGDDLVVALDRRDSNAPVVGAAVSVREGGKAVPLRPTKPGEYAAKVALVGAPGAHDLTIAANVDGRDDKLTGSLVVAASGNAAVPHRHPDGAVFLAKAAQHLLDVRTIVAPTVHAAPRRQL